MITSQAMKTINFRRFCEFQIKNILLSHKFLDNNRISCTIVILTVQQILLKRLSLSKRGITFLKEEVENSVVEKRP